MDNSIKLKELQVISGALRQGDERLGTFFFLFQKGFFGWGGEGREGAIPPFSKRGFFRGLGEVNFSWVAWEGEVWLFFKVGRWDF